MGEDMGQLMPRTTLSDLAAHLSLKELVKRITPCLEKLRGKFKMSFRLILGQGVTWSRWMVRV